MKTKSIIVPILLVTTILSLSACGNQAAPASIVTEAETELETNILESTETIESEIETESLEPTEESSTFAPETETETVLETETETADAVPYTVEPYSAELYATKTCNVRQAPTTDSDIVGSVPSGNKVTVTGKTTYKDKNWYKVNVNGTENEFISASLLSNTKPVPPKTEEKTNVGTVVTPGSNTTTPADEPEDNSPAATGQNTEPHELDRVVTNPDGSTTTIGWGTDPLDLPPRR